VQFRGTQGALKQEYPRRGIGHRGPLDSKRMDEITSEGEGGSGWLEGVKDAAAPPLSKARRSPE
jgi:hypothetical protein